MAKDYPDEGRLAPRLCFSKQSLNVRTAEQVKQRTVKILDKNPGLYGSIRFNFKNGELMNSNTVVVNEKENDGQ